MANSWRKSRVNEPEHLEALAKVTTIREVMTLYNVKYPSSVMWLILNGELSAVQIGSTWVIAMDSVISWYGEPTEESLSKLTS